MTDRQYITVTDNSFADIINEIEGYIDNLPEVSLMALKAQQEVLQQGVKQAYVSTGGRQGSYIYESVGQSQTYSKNNPNDVVGTVGVYHVDRIAARFGKTEKDLNAAQVSYWIEHGTSRIRGGGRKKKGLEYDPEDLITVAPRPFISQGVYAKFEEGQQAFAEVFNRELDKVKK